MRFPKSLSIIIPVFNEEKRLKKGLAVCKKYKQRFPDWEFIFVNDGSTDRTEEMLRASGFKLVSYKKNRGKGYALKQGVKEANKTLVLLCDVDFSTPLSELPKLYREIKTEIKIVIGSRKMQGAEVIKHQPRLREWLGVRFTDLSNLWLGLKIADFTCGFKLFTTPAAKKIFERQRIKRWGYDSEIIFIADKLDIKLKQVPVVWKNDERTKVSLIKDVARSLVDLWLIRFYNLLGSYQK